VILAWLALAGLSATGGRAQLAEQLFAQRGDPAALDGALQAALEAAASAPADAGIRLLLARAELFWCDLHPEATPKDTRAHLEVGLSAADEALRLLSPGFRASIDGGSELSRSLASIEPQGAPALFWFAADQHRLCAVVGLRCLLVEADELKSLFARVEELAPGFYHGGPERHLAELELALPTGFGASMKTTAARLARSLSQGPGLLETHVVWAQRWAVKAQNYRAFQAQLKQVLDASPDAAPDLRPENTLSQRRARDLLAHHEELFTRPARDTVRENEPAKARPP
jgi:TRAP transporter T-component